MKTILTTLALAVLAYVVIPIAVPAGPYDDEWKHWASMPLPTVKGEARQFVTAEITSVVGSPEPWLED
jgi:hypothetical protein